MIGIHCLSSKPMLRGRGINGTFGKYAIDLPEYMLLMLKLSALAWKKNNGKILLYTDTPMKEYLERKNMISAWDGIDTDLLDNFEKNYPSINPTVFWSASKFACYAESAPPFVCLDTDLVVWKKLRFEPAVAFAFSHWELIENGDENYPPLSQLVTPESYQVYPACRFCKKASNMSVTYFGNDDFKNRFITEAFAFMTHNKVDSRKRYATPEILYMEQRLPLAIAIEMNLKYEPIIDSVWSPLRSRFTQLDPRYGDYFFAQLDDTKPYTHMWFYKTHLQSDAEAREAYVKELKNKLIQLDA